MRKQFKIGDTVIFCMGKKEPIYIRDGHYFGVKNGEIGKIIEVAGSFRVNFPGNPGLYVLPNMIRHVGENNRECICLLIRD